MRIFLDTLGCRLNEAELARWARGFRAAGHHVVGRPEEAAVCILNTCAVTSEAVRKSKKATRALHRRNPKARIVLTGCHVSLAPEAAAALAGVDLVVHNRDKDHLVKTVIDRLGDGTMPTAAADAETSYPRRRTRAFVKVQDGCRNRCTFCIVTVARGAERSQSIDDVVDELNHLHRRGFKEAVLTGVHLGGWGRDLGKNLPDLLDAVLERTTIPWIRVGSLEPWELPADFFERWADPRLCPHLHLPIQSGCNSVLKRMARRGSVEEYTALFERARSQGIRITTDLIVGFPGETDAEHEATAAFVEAQRFDDVHLFTYSPREGTAAARMSSRPDKEVVRRRSDHIRTLVRQQRIAYLDAHVGTQRPVHWEGGRATDRGVVWSGYTDHYVRVELAAPGGRNRADHIEMVTITGAREDRLVTLA